MKKIVLLIVAISLFNSLQAQTPSSCSMPPLLATEYKRDIAQLAVYRLFQLQSPDTEFVTIPQASIDTISEGLAAIFNATILPERDSIFNLYCIHNLNPFTGFGAYTGFLIKIDTSYAWTNAWQNLITITGHPLMDTLLTKYHLTITHFYNWAIGDYAVLSVDSSWNIFALMDSIEMVPGVISVEQNSLVGVAGKISYNTIGNTRYYDFYFEYQDCFDGCGAFRKWKFKVNPDCSVDYLGFDNWCYWDQLGTPGLCPFPTPLHCNTFTPVKEISAQEINVVLSPNPTNGSLQIEMSGVDFQHPMKLEIYNLQGSLIWNATLSSPKSQFDLGYYGKGVSLVKIFNAETILHRKIVVQ